MWARFWKWLCSLCSCGRNPAPSTSSTVQIHEKKHNLSDFDRDVKAFATSQRETKQRESIAARQAEIELAAKQREEKREKDLQQKMQEQRTAALAAQQKKIAEEKARQKLKEDEEKAASQRQYEDMLAFMHNPQSQQTISSRHRSPSLLFFRRRSSSGSTTNTQETGQRRRSSSASTADTQEPGQSDCCAWLSSKVKYCCACFFRKSTSQSTRQSTSQPVRIQTNTTDTSYESFVTLSEKSSPVEEFVTLSRSRISPKMLRN